MILEEDWEFLNSNEHGRRVEIDNVIGYVGTERFWNEFILPSFAKLFVEVNYNLSLNSIKYVILPELTILNELARKIGTEVAADVVEKIEFEYANYDISCHGFISDITIEEQKTEKRIMEREFHDKDIQWLSERLESINKELNERTRSTLITENVHKKGKNGDIDDPEYDKINIDDDAEDIISENHTREELD